MKSKSAASGKGKLKSILRNVKAETDYGFIIASVIPPAAISTANRRGAKALEKRGDRRSTQCWLLTQEIIKANKNLNVKWEISGCSQLSRGCIVLVTRESRTNWPPGTNRTPQIHHPHTNTTSYFSNKYHFHNYKCKQPWNIIFYLKILLSNFWSKRNYNTCTEIFFSNSKLKYMYSKMPGCPFVNQFFFKSYPSKFIPFKKIINPYFFILFFVFLYFSGKLWTLETILGNVHNIHEDDFLNFRHIRKIWYFSLNIATLYQLFFF